MNVLLENILKYVKEKQQVSHKPAILPISSLTEMETFETIDDDTYYDVVSKKKNDTLCCASEYIF